MRVVSVSVGASVAAMATAILFQVSSASAADKPGRSAPARAVSRPALPPAVPGLLPPSVSEHVAPRHDLPSRLQSGREAKKVSPSSGSPLMRVSTPARRVAGSNLVGRGIAASVVRPSLPGNTRSVATPLDRLFDRAQKGDPVAQYHVGRLYRTGVGVRPDAAMAMTWFMRAAHNNLAGAHYHIGLMQMAGENGRPNIVEAYARFKMAAAGGDVRAAAFLFYIGVRMTAKELRRSQMRLADLRRTARAVAASAAAK